MERLQGLTSHEALQRLHGDLWAEVKVYQGKTKNSSLLEKWQSSSLHHSCRQCVFHWTNALVLVLLSVACFISYGLNPHRSVWLVVEGIVLLILLALNLYFNLWDNRLRETEMLDKTKGVLQKIRECIKRDIWNSSHYINLHSPISQCVQLQWTLRDGDLVNLPVNLLVEGDVIYLRPGQTVPGRCRQILQGDAEGEAVTLTVQDTYQPEQGESPPESIQYGVTAKKPRQPAPFVMLETPFVENIRGILNKSLSRPCSMLTNERFDTYDVWVERRIIPFILVLGVFTNTLRFVFLKSDLGHWSEVFITLQVQCVFPLTALVFPVMYKVLELFGNAKVYTAFLQDLDEKPSLSVNYSEREISLQRDMAAPVDQDRLMKNFKKILLGESACLPRTTSLLKTLGNITSFCCVDKKGVLSWPNPTAEKVFFLRHGDSRHKESVVMEDNADSAATRGAGVASDSKPPNSCYKNSLKQDLFLADCDFEVLDLTHDSKNGYSLNFDDKSWRKHLHSLKPLGLNILLNTCNIDTAESYTEFADHVTCEALQREDAVPVVNRRCFCELSKQMGFSDKASDIFDLQHVLGLYKHVARQECEKPSPVQRSKSFIKYKMPMPNAFSVVVKEKSTGMSQQFSQGTGDILLDACSDYWDGHDVCSLSSTERKKISDFYHRASMSSYCTAFAYRPITESLTEGVSQYIEVSETVKNAFSSCDSPSSNRKNRTWGKNSVGGPAGVSYSSTTTPHPSPAPYHGSADSLMLGSSLVSVHQLDSCFQTQCNQIFIGMISMQYQAKQDIVQLIEDLENACIRFVHFSKENELRSRVFSEKMGLEAGWNCHISLLSHAATADTHSSPSQQDLLSHQATGTEGSKATSQFSSHQSIDATHQKMFHKQVSRETTPGLLQEPPLSMAHRRLSAPGDISLNTSGHPSTSCPGNAPLLQGSSHQTATLPGDFIEQEVRDEEKVVTLAVEEVADDGVYVKDPPLGGALDSQVVEESSDHVHFDINEPLLFGNDREGSAVNKRHKQLHNQADTASSHNSTISGFDDLPTKMATDSWASLDKDKVVSSSSRARKDCSKGNQSFEQEDSVHFPLLYDEPEVISPQKSSTDRGRSQNINSHNNFSKEEGQNYDPNDSLESYPPSSYVTENTDSVAGFGLLNRAKLPRGIENIRPHIENVDNVPLLVSLFTDCVPESTQKMLNILQEYGEVVCCLGSSADSRNTDSFLQADCSLGVEPLYPQLCVKYPVVQSRWQEGGLEPSPMQLSGWLNTLPCALAFERADNFRLLHLVAIARHHCGLLRNTFLVLLMLQCFVSAVMFLSQPLLLPPPLAPHHVMWLVVVVMPLLSLCMMGAEADGDIGKMAQGKNLKQLCKRNVCEFVLYYLFRFLPSALVCLLIHGLTLNSLCQHFVTISYTSPGNHSNDCHPLIGNVNYNRSSTWNGWSTDYGAGLSLSQNLVALQVVLISIGATMCLMYRRNHLWQKSPFRNKYWVITSLIIMLAQVVYFAADLHIAKKSQDTLSIQIGLVPVPVWVLTFLWTPVTVAIHELAKRREIKMSVRYQKRARLDFGTKLGMNSPF